MASPVIDGWLRNRCPVDLHPLPPVRVSSPEEIRTAAAAAARAQPGWAALPFRHRVRLLRRAARRMLARREEALELLHDETGKSPGEALMTEAIGPLQLVNDWARVVGPYLKPRRVRLSRMAFPGKGATIEVVPRGVIGVIAPWNYPLAYFFKPVFAALLCGDAVIIKPSEHAPRTALWFTAILNEFLPPGLLHCVPGDRDAGEALIGSSIDAVTFTGSFASGQKVAALAARHMIPCSAELGGNDAAIVLADCDLPRTVRGIAQWALHNAGQACGAIDRVYVETAVADRFVDGLGRLCSDLRSGSGLPATSDIGPLAHAGQLETVEALVAEALAEGATLVCGGRRSGPGLWYQPTVLDHCRQSMRICREPSFGPVIPVIRVSDAQEAVRLANDSCYGLCGSVWSRDEARAAGLAARLEVGIAFVNNHAFTGGVVAAPWTGVKHTGYGIANSEFALAHYTRPRTLVTDRSSGPDLYWFPITATLEQLGQRLAEVQLGKVWSGLRLPGLVRRRKRETGRGVAEPEAWSASASPRRGPRPGRATARVRLPLLAFERAWGRAAFDTIFFDSHAGDRPLPPLAPGEPEDFLADFFAAAPLLTRIGLRCMIWVAGLAPLVYRRRPVPLHRLSPAERVEVMERLARSDAFLARQATTFLKAVGALSYLKTSRMQAAPGPPAGRRPASDSAPASEAKVEP
jgi:acyl-CoA reductase-like NAD-dependent aldehyde dehydrogenase